MTIPHIFRRYLVADMTNPYGEAEGLLNIYAPSNTKAIADLQGMFAKNILKLETLAEGQIDKRAYDLAPEYDLAPMLVFRWPKNIL